MRNMQLKNKNGLTEEEFLKRYKPGDYERPSNTVDMLLFTVDDKPVEDVRKLPDKELKILLIKRGDHPYMDCWAIPGGFVNIDEGLNSAVHRELKEETNVENVYFEQLYTWGDNVKRDPRMRVISVSYIALVDKHNIKPQAGDDAADTKWFSIKKNFISSDKNKKERIDTYNLILTSDDGEITVGYLVKEKYIKQGIMTTKETSYEVLEWSREEFAFDHVQIIDTALDRLKNKIEYTQIAFTLLPEYFTLTELQRVYEVILNKSLIKANFRRKIMPMVKETTYVKETGGHRPAKYFTFNEDWEHNFLNEL